jgi:hypothetical protein
MKLILHNLKLYKNNPKHLKIIFLQPHKLLLQKKKIPTGLKCKKKLKMANSKLNPMLFLKFHLKKIILKLPNIYLNQPPKIHQIKI